jgi:SWI/SNF-related matrix-associated actin-dependent regulator of chromatin subfamily D
MHAQIFGQDVISFQKLPDLVNRFLTAPEPVVLHYIVNPGTPPPERPQAYDVEVKTEDTALKQKMTVTISASKESGQTLLKLDEEVFTISLGLIAFIDNFFCLDFHPCAVIA